MTDNLLHTPLDLERSLRRSRGRAGRTISATARVTRDEQNEMEEAAAAKGQSLSEWCRETLLGAARGQRVTPEFTEVVAMRSLLIATLRNIACGKTMTPEAFAAELMTIRQNKHKSAAQLMQQYQEKEGEQ
jgi:hypothetical protein